MRIALIDDENDFRPLFRQALIINNISDSFDFYTDVKKFVTEANQYDAVFLDIQIEEENGIQTAKILHEHHPDLLVIFLTNYSDLVFEAFGLNVIAFIEKKYLNEKISKCFSRIKAELSARKYIIVNTDEKKTVSIKLSSVSYFEKYKKKTDIFLDTGTVYTANNLTIKELNEYLDKSIFVLANRSIIVNIQKIRSIGEEMIWLEGYKKPIYISRSRYKELKTRFIEYYS